MKDTVISVFVEKKVVVIFNSLAMNRTWREEEFEDSNICSTIICWIKYLRRLIRYKDSAYLFLSNLSDFYSYFTCFVLKRLSGGKVQQWPWERKRQCIKSLPRLAYLSARPCLSDPACLTLLVWPCLSDPACVWLSGRSILCIWLPRLPLKGNQLQVGRPHITNFCLSPSETAESDASQRGLLYLQNQLRKRVGLSPGAYVWRCSSGGKARTEWMDETLRWNEAWRRWAWYGEIDVVWRSPVAKKDFNFDNSVKGLKPECARQEDFLLQIEATIIVSLRENFQIDDANGFFNLNQTSRSSSCAITYDRQLLDLVRDNLQMTLTEGKARRTNWDCYSRGWKEGPAMSRRATSSCAKPI